MTNNPSNIPPIVSKDKKIYLNMVGWGPYKEHSYRDMVRKEKYEALKVISLATHSYSATKFAKFFSVL